MENENKVQARDVEIDLEKNGKDVAGGNGIFGDFCVDGMIARDAKSIVAEAGVNDTIAAGRKVVLIGGGGTGKTAFVSSVVDGIETFR